MFQNMYSEVVVMHSKHYKTHCTKLCIMYSSWHMCLIRRRCDWEFFQNMWQFRNVYQLRMICPLLIYSFYFTHHFLLEKCILCQTICKKYKFAIFCCNLVNLPLFIENQKVKVLITNVLFISILKIFIGNEQIKCII